MFGDSQAGGEKVEVIPRNGIIQLIPSGLREGPDEPVLHHFGVEEQT